MHVPAPLPVVLMAAAIGLALAPPVRADCLPDGGCLGLTPTSGAPGTRIRGTTGVRCVDEPVTLRLYLYQGKGYLYEPPPADAPWTDVRARGHHFGMRLRFTVPRLAPGTYQLAIGCPPYDGQEAWIAPVSPDMLTIIGRLPDTATATASRPDLTRAAAWLVALVLGGTAWAVRPRRPSRRT